MNPNSYHVSRHSDVRDAIEIVAAAGYEDAADKAHYTYGMAPVDGNLYVIRNGDLRIIEVEWIEESLVSGVDDSYPQTGEELL